VNKTVSIVAIAVAGIALAGCGGSNKAARGAVKGMNTMTMESNVPFDRAFIDAMVPHHRSAIAMAETAQTEGLASPKLNMIVVDIVDSQQKEIDQMLAWREQWYGSRKLDPNAGKELGMSMAEMGMAHDSGDMKGSSGVVDQMFASMMTDHHKGAIAMARMALERGEHPEIKTLARAIIAAQEREVKIMAPFAKKNGGHTTTGMSMG
jgi:uncharacterized protein (DUF305 family)